jgi:hypothetical protein
MYNKTPKRPTPNNTQRQKDMTKEKKGGEEKTRGNGGKM